MACNRLIPLLALALAFSAAVPALASGQPPSRNEAAALEFFEKKVRPVLVGHCYTCHSANTNSKGGLRVDDRNGLLQGGNTGPLIVTYNREELIRDLNEVAKYDWATFFHEHIDLGTGRKLDRIVKINVVLADIRHYDEMNRVWREFFSTEPPARTTCALQLSNGNGVEIECIALSGR